jgi:pilus assembly protein Flp/PilA
MNSSFFPKKHEKGQGLVEYALILVLVAIVVIAALMILGPIIGNVFSKVNSSLSTVSTGGSAVVVNTAIVSCTPGNAPAANSSACTTLMTQNHCTHRDYEHGTCSWH